MKKIVFTGPESSGKTTLSRWAATRFGGEWVEEFSRKFLEQRGGKYLETDLEKIAAGQVNLQKKAAARRPDFLFCDTDLTVVQIWQTHKFGKANPKIFKHLQQNLADFYLLCSPDLDWEYDPLREASGTGELQVLFEKYHALLVGLEVPFAVVRGSGEARFRLVESEILRRFF